ncbi:hypothetical protein [Rheinheimera texasensis]|uniref:hypothetical protein n=1 Tax=Rheinheimera texasensis TaxID=306205 RepID=UPI0004E25FBF|nr:hypothetical protein [Rheinheimera texasensis]
MTTGASLMHCQTFYFRLFIWFCLGLPAAAKASTAPELIWLTEHAPNQALQVLDINETTFRLLESQLPGVKISRQQATTAQAAKLLQHRPNVCVGNKLASPDRRSWGMISHQPQVIFPGLRLYVLQSSGLRSWLAQLSSGKPLSLQRVLSAHQRFKLGFNTDRSYGNQLDSLLKQAANQRNLFSRSGPDNAGGLLQMFSLGRIDLLIEYPNVVEHYLAQLPKPPAVQSFALQESPALLPGHIICSDTPQGRLLLTSLDQTISKVSQQQAYLDAHLHWFAPALHAELTALYNQTYGTNF